jgi:NDP-sugar pyrophosphorylase family protein
MAHRAIILAGGKGTRLRPFTLTLPKPLVPIGDTPVLEIIIRQLKQRDFGHLTMAVNHQADIIRAYFGNGDKWGIQIDYSLESMPLGTMGPLRLIRDLPDNFLVMNGDILTDLDFDAFLRKHTSEGNLFTISAARRQQLIDFGVLGTDAAGYLNRFDEKPKESFLVSMGVYAVSHRILEWLPKDQPYGFDQLMRALIQEGQKVAVKEHPGYWLDIGRPEDYQRATDDFADSSERFLK